MKMTYLPIVTVICLLSCIIPLLHAQEPQENWVLQNPESGNKTYVARDAIVLKPGFSYTASSGHSFRAKIDPGLLFPPAENTYMDSNGGITTDPTQGGVVGAISGTFNVTPSGAATYTVPIECPVGINGMQPNISLVYNSRSGNGIAGLGWSISGISIIGRTGSSFYHDGKSAAIELNQSDNLALDGQRMVLISGTHFVNGAKYRTEIETYNDITYKQINGYQCFEVITKEGIKMEYGASADSYIEAQGSTIPLVWLLTKTTDPNGNYISYSYGEDHANGEYWLSNIYYTGNAFTGTSPVNRIEFIYHSDRNDSSVSYVAGKKMMQTKTLLSIKTQTNAQVCREYSFTYQYDGFYTKLSSVDLKTSDGTRYRPTIIDWQNDHNLYPGDSITMKNVTLQYGTLNNIPLFVDLNNDGYADLIRTIEDMAGYSQHYLGYEVYLSTNNGQTFILNQDDYGYTGSITSQLVPADINKDTFMDIIEIRFAYTHYILDVLLNINGQLVRQELTALDFPKGNDDEYYFDFQDFNGDGETELLVRSETSSGKSLSLYKINIENDTKELLSVTNSMDMSTIHSYRLKDAKMTDVNGNGKVEIYFERDRVILEYDAATNKFVKLPILIDFNSLCSFSEEVECADINGDGKTDIVCYIGEDWKIMLSTGISFTEIPSPITRTRSGASSAVNYIYRDFYAVNDYNGDGKADIMEIYEENNVAVINIYYYNGKTFIKKNDYPIFILN
jgi:hypothetical protein